MNDFRSRFELVLVRFLIVCFGKNDQKYSWSILRKQDTLFTKQLRVASCVLQACNFARALREWLVGVSQNYRSKFFASRTICD